MYLIFKLLTCTAIIHSTSGREFQVRLAGGPSKAEGRVEVAYEGVWGTICENSHGFPYSPQWDDNDARVICRQLNFTDGVARRNNYYGPGKGPIWLYNVKCNGTESRIGACSAGGFNTSYWMCGEHDTDVSVFCTNKVRLQPNAGYGAVQIWANNTYQLICDDGFDEVAANLVCKYLGFKNGTVLTLAPNTTLNYVVGYTAVNCQYSQSILDCIESVTNDSCLSKQHASVVCFNRPIEFELEKGEDHQGMVSINHYGKIRQLCANTFGDSDATVVCRELGFGGGFAYRRTSKYRRYYKKNPTVPWLPWISNGKCSGNENSIGECGKLTFGCDGQKEQASAYCYRKKGYELRLANKDNDMARRVEISIDGKWGTICSVFFGFNNNAADVICRQLGYTGGKHIPNDIASRKQESGKGPVYITSLDCSGAEKSLMECPMIIDSGRVPEPLYYNMVYAYMSCYSHFYDARVQCHNSIRLSATDKSFYGIVEMQVEGKWLAACDTTFSDATANVVCRSVGYKYGKYQPGSIILPDKNTTTNIKLHLQCKGREKRVEDCKFWTGSCSSRKYVTVYCSNEEIKTNKMLLLRKQYGILMVNKYGFWGTICTDGWTNVTANAACRQLGHAGGIATTTYAARHITAVGGFQCSKSSANLNECSYKGFGEDLGVGCQHHAKGRKTVSVRCHDDNDVKNKMIK